MNECERIKRNWKSDLLGYLPESVAELLQTIDESAPLEEIRIRAQRPIELCFAGSERLVYGRNGRAAVSQEDCRTLLTRLCEQSVYAWETELQCGFLTLPGGYRVGLCGRASMHDGAVERLCDVTSFNIRIAREVHGVASGVLPLLVDREGRLLSTLVVSAPGCGKTTLLRDLARCCSYGVGGVRASRVAIVDTRYELAGAARGVPQLDVGPRTDVLSGVSKAIGMRMLVTNMAPDVLVTDELSCMQDAYAALDATACGIAVAASAHASCGETMLKRQTMRLLVENGLFERIVVLGKSHGTGTVEQVLNQTFERVVTEEKICSAQLLSWPHSAAAFFSD
ncbi:MAG: stage III sporulation protein AA [Clostridia bacterium]